MYVYDDLAKQNALAQLQLTAQRVGTTLRSGEHEHEVHRWHTSEQVLFILHWLMVKSVK